MSIMHNVYVLYVFVTYLFLFFLFTGALLCSLCLVVRGVYSASDDVIELTPSNFNREVIQSDGLWLVEFFAPW